VVFDYADDLGSPAAGTIPTDALVAAAKEVLRAVQEELLQRTDRPPIDDKTKSEHIEFAHARHWALCALRDRMTAAEAKRIDLEVTDTTPLTVCTGATLPKRPHNSNQPHRTYGSNRPPFLAGAIIKVDVGEQKAQIPVSGCLRIFPDTTQTSRKPWRYWCPGLH
jgi:hypothetical protein